MATTKAELAEKIEKYKKTIKANAVSPAIIEAVKAKLKAAEEELAGFEEKEKSSAPVATASGSKAELAEKIEKYKKTIKANAVSPAIIEGVKAKLKAAEEALGKLEEKKEEKSEPKSAKAETKAKAKKEPKAKSPAKKSPKAKAKKEKEKEKSNAQVNKSSRTVTIAGETFSVDKCGEAIEAWEAEIDRKRASGKKFAKKSSGEVVGDKLASAGAKVLTSIKKEDVANDPTFYRKELKKLSEAMETVAQVIDTILGKKDASAEVKDLVKQIQEWVKKNLA